MATLPVGSRVRIHGLKSRPEMNNAFGTVVEPSSAEVESLAKSGRCKVLPRGQSASRALSLKPENVILVDSVNDLVLFTRNADIAYPQEFIATLLVALSDLKLHNRLPPVTENDKSINLLFVGASVHYELSMDFQAFFEPLKKFFYPELQLLNVAVIGPDIPTGHTIPSSDSVRVTVVSKKLEKSPSVLVNATSTVAIIAVPGFTSYLDSWTPAVNRILDANIPTVLTCYSLVDKPTDDALFDEDVLLRYFGANVIVPTSANLHYLPSPRGGAMVKNAFYMAFQGRAPDAALVPPQQYNKDMCARYMRFQGDFYRDQNAYYSEACYQMHRDLLSGALPYTGQTTEQLVMMAQQMSF